MKIPSTLKIGAHEFQVIRRPMDDKVGLIDPCKQTITLDTEIHGTIEVATLIHEALHVMNSTLDHPLLDSLSEQIAQFLIDNNLLRT